MMIAVMLLLNIMVMVMVLRRVRNDASLAVVHLRGEHWRVRHLMLLRVGGRGWIDKYWRHQVVIGCRNC